MHAYGHLEWQHCIQSSSAPKHTRHISTGTCNEMLLVGQMEGAEQVTEIISSFSLSEVVILSESAISFSVFPRGPPERWRDSPLIQDAQFSGPK